MQEDFQSEKEVEGTRGWQMLQTAHILKQKGVCLCVCERGREGGLKGREKEREQNWVSKS